MEQRSAGKQKLMNQDKEKAKQPTIVKESNPSQQVGEEQSAKDCAKFYVWTHQMLDRLAKSEPTTKWFRLWDKVCSKVNLHQSFMTVRKNRGAPGCDEQTIERFEAQLDRELEGLIGELKSGTYRPLPAKRVWINKLGSTEKRPLGIPAVRDRVVQTALRNVLEPIWEKDFAEHSYGFRPARSGQQAIQRIEQLLDKGYTHVVDADLKSYFDTINHDKLMLEIRKRIVDGSVLKLLESYLKAGVLDELKGRESTDQGTPQGSVISPLLANLYLNPLDHMMAEKGWEMVRYADDFVILCRSGEDAKAALAFIEGWMKEADLTLHPTKTRLVEVEHDRFDFLGWTFSIKNKIIRKWPRKKSVEKLRNNLRPKTKRNNGQGIAMVIATINPILRGWRAYFKDAKPHDMEKEDGWLRRRLRAMLSKQQKKPCFGMNETTHKQWPNQWFAEQGLYSLRAGSCCYV
jgi:RNA-directed DNA polymerase